MVDGQARDAHEFAVILGRETQSFAMGAEAIDAEAEIFAGGGAGLEGICGGAGPAAMAFHGAHAVGQGADDALEDCDVVAMLRGEALVRTVWAQISRRARCTDVITERRQDMGICHSSEWEQTQSTPGFCMWPLFFGTGQRPGHASPAGRRTAQPCHDRAQARTATNRLLNDSGPK